MTQLSLTYLIQVLLLLDVVPNGERGRGGGGGRERGERRKKEVDEKRMKRVEGGRSRRGEDLHLSLTTGKKEAAKLCSLSGKSIGGLTLDDTSYYQWLGYRESHVLVRTIFSSP